MHNTNIDFSAKIKGLGFVLEENFKYKTMIFSNGTIYRHSPEFSFESIIKLSWDSQGEHQESFTIDFHGSVELCRGDKSV